MPDDCSFLREVRPRHRSSQRMPSPGFPILVAKGQLIVVSAVDEKILAVLVKVLPSSHVIQMGRIDAVREPCRLVGTKRRLTTEGQPRVARDSPIEMVEHHL